MSEIESPSECLKKLRQTIIELIEDLKKNIFLEEEEQGDLMIVLFFFQRMHEERLAQHVIDHVLPHKKQIERRDTGFFLKNKGIFSGLPDDRVEYYRDIIISGDRLDDDDRTVLWEYFDTIVYYAEKYKKII